MPRTFLVERIVDMTSSVNSTDVTDDVTLDGGLHEEQRCDEMRQKTMTSQRRGVAMDTSVVDYRAGVGALGQPLHFLHALKRVCIKVFRLL